MLGGREGGREGSLTLGSSGGQQDLPANNHPEIRPLVRPEKEMLQIFFTGRCR